jgi:hypothetical protein
MGIQKEQKYYLKNYLHHYLQLSYSLNKIILEYLKKKYRIQKKR